MGALTGRNLLSLAELSPKEIAELLNLARDLKVGKLKPRTDKTLGLVFSKASTRTRVSFSTAMFQMGGNVLDLNASISQVGRGEPVQDTARVLSRYLDAIAVRTFAQADLETYAQYADVPVINALTDLYHPCQVLADLQTLQENFGDLKGLTLTYCGDGNNMAHSILLGCALTGVNCRIAAPEDFQPLPEVVEQAKALRIDPNSEITITPDPQAAATGADALYTDVWASMGQEDEADDRLPRFTPYQINDNLMKLANPQAIVLHCLPAHREEEITESVMEGPQSRIWDQAENRLHAQKALLVSLLGLL